VLLVFVAAASGCDEGSTLSSPNGAAASGGASSGSGGQSAGAGVVGGTAGGGSEGAAANAAGMAGLAGGGSASTGGGGQAGSAGAAGASGSGGGGPTAPKMCEEATSALPSFKRVAAANETIAGAVGVVGNPEVADVLYVPQHFTGDVRVVQAGTVLDEPLLHVDVRQNPPGREQGLLAIALHPRFASNHLMYVYYSAANPVGQSTIEEFKLDSPTQATPVRKVYEQAHSHQFHNGGNLQFGPDEWLYFSVGDNQGDCGPSCAQAAEGPYGRIKKVDVAAADPDGTAKTFNNGLRNPWRWSFDPLTFDVVVGDVGEGGGSSEKLFFAARAESEGKNWGWAPGSLDNRNPAGTISTLAADGGAIIGGVVYRGSNPRMAGACGVIFFGHLEGQVYTINRDGSDRAQQGPLSGTNDLASFGVDAAGEIYLTYLGGQVFRIDAE
jgi:glucose/arabinose dehydrogenase